MKIIYMGTPEFAVPILESIYNAGYDISLVITQKDKPKGRGKKVQYTPVKVKALELGLEVYQPEIINDNESINIIRKINPDIIVVAAYGQLLKRELLNIPKYGCINVHASLLPKFRGAAPINWAIINGESITGITIMKMEEGLDTGDMIMKCEVEIIDDDDYLSMHNKLANIGSRLIVKTMEDILNNNVSYTPQDSTKSTYAPMIYKNTGKIDWSKSGKDIYNLVRGLKPWPIAHTDYNGENIKIHNVEYLIKQNDELNGLICKVDKEGIYVSVNDGYIIIKELQFPGKKVLTVKQYLAGNRINEGVILK